MKIPLINSQNLHNNLPVKILWKNAGVCDERRIFEPFSLHKGVIGDVFVNISKYCRGEENLFIEIKNRFGKELGHELFSMEKGKSKNIFGFDIQVADEYRQKSFRIGELLRLASIMEMVENKSPHIKICTKNTAVYFHGKYKFEPDITSFDERNQVLKSIIADKSPGFKDITDKAKKLLQEAVVTAANPVNQRDLCVRTNVLVKEYIERALLEKNPEKSHPFNYGFYMILKKDTVKNFNEYFNQMFKRQGIDYRI